MAFTFTKEEISIIDKNLGFIVFDWATHLVNHILSAARSEGVEVVYMNTPKTIDSGATQEGKLDFFYERLPPRLGFKKEKVNLRSKGKETLWAYRFDVITASCSQFIKLSQSVALESIPQKYQGAFPQSRTETCT